MSSGAACVSVSFEGESGEGGVWANTAFGESINPKLIANNAIGYFIVDLNHSMNNASAHRVLLWLNLEINIDIDKIAPIMLDKNFKPSYDERLV